MDYHTIGRNAGHIAGLHTTSTELRNDLLNKRKFYRVKTQNLNPLQTGTFVKEGCGISMAFFCSQ